MIKASLVCNFEFVCYLEFVFWCLSDITQYPANKYFAKNSQKNVIYVLALLRSYLFNKKCNMEADLKQ